MKKLILLLSALVVASGCALTPFATLESYSKKVTVKDPKTAYIKAVNCVGSSYQSAGNAPLFSYQSDTLYGFRSTFYFYHTGFAGMAWQYRATLNYMTIDNEVTLEISNVEECINGPSKACQDQSRDGLEVNKRTKQMLDDLEKCMQ